jgi:hypothetical protein
MNRTRLGRTVAASVIAVAMVVGAGASAQAAIHNNVWGELNGDGLVVNYSTYRPHTASIRPKMHLDQVTAFNFRLWFRNSVGTRVSDRAWFHTPGKTTYWYSPSGSQTIASGSYKLSGYMEGTLRRPFDRGKIRWQGDITL